MYENQHSPPQGCPLEKGGSARDVTFKTLEDERHELGDTARHGINSNDTKSLQALEALVAASIEDTRARVSGLPGYKAREHRCKQIDSLRESEKLHVVTIGVDLGRLSAHNNYGEACGNAAIKRFADTLRSFFREDEIFHHGGDEFSVIATYAEENSPDQAELSDALFTSIIARLAAVGYVAGKKSDTPYTPLPLFFRVGLKHSPPSDIPPSTEELLEQSDPKAGPGFIFSSEGILSKATDTLVREQYEQLLWDILKEDYGNADKEQPEATSTERAMAKHAIAATPATTQAIDLQLARCRAEIDALTNHLLEKYGASQEIKKRTQDTQSLPTTQ